MAVAGNSRIGHAVVMRQAEAGRKKICIRLEPNAAASVPMFGASAKMLAEIRLKRC
jgi:hypothetical protein